MPRAPYDTTVDLIYGPDGVSPGLVYSTQNCRFVPSIVTPHGPAPLDQAVGYVTMDGPEPNLAFVITIGSVFSWNMGFADRLAVPHGAAANYLVLWIDHVVYRTHPPYYRVWVGPA